jgi:hypothetical protein
VIFAARLAVLGAMFITPAAILPSTTYNIQENQLIRDIRQDMGAWIHWNYFNEENGDWFPNVTVQEEEGMLRVYSILGVRIPDFRPYRLEEVRANGLVVFFPEVEILNFFYHDPDTNNFTQYAVDIGFREAIWVDINSHELVPHYQPQKSFQIFLRGEDATATGSDRADEYLGNYYSVRNRPILDWLKQIIIAISENFITEFLFVGNLLLITVAVGGGASIITAFFLILFRIVRLIGGRFWTYMVLKMLNGKTGKLIGYIPVFDFNGETYVEESFVNTINLSGVRSTLSELYRQRGYDILFFPTALAAILTIFFVQNSPFEDKVTALVWSPILSPLVLLILLFYFPVIWSFNEGGFKRLQSSPQGDIVAVKPLGKILRDGLGIIIGFSGIISLGALAVQVTESFAGQATSSEGIQVAGFSLDLFGIALLIFWTIGLFLILLASVLVGASLIAVAYLQSTHLNTIKALRERSEKDRVISNFGSLSTQFKPKAIETIYSTDDQ